MYLISCKDIHYTYTLPNQIGTRIDKQYKVGENVLIKLIENKGSKKLIENKGSNISFVPNSTNFNVALNIKKREIKY